MGTWSCSLMFNIALRQLFFNTLNFLVSSCVRDHVSEPYIAIGSINALWRRSFNFTEMSLRDHTPFLKLPNFLFTLSDEFGTRDLKFKFFHNFDLLVFNS